MEHDPIIHDSNLYLLNKINSYFKFDLKHTVPVYMLDLMNVEYIVYNEKHEMLNHIKNLLVINNPQPDVT